MAAYSAQDPPRHVLLTSVGSPFLLFPTYSHASAENSKLIL